MTITIVIIAGLLLVAGLSAFIWWGSRWGSTPDERVKPLPGDAFFGDSDAPRVIMTRAIDIDAAPEIVWPWLTQMGRGAGWYSYDRLDNRGLPSAEHIVSWIPDPALGDASAIGYLRHFVPEREISWWAGGLRFGGARARLAVDLSLAPKGAGSRLIVRMSADANGAMGKPALLIFRFIDSIMARKQLLGMKQRAERYQNRGINPERPETGERDQFQLYEVVYAGGERAGVPGKDLAERWRQAAIEDGVINESPGSSLSEA